MKKSTSGSAPLRITRDTIRRLTDDHLRAVGGGDEAMTRGCTDTCGNCAAERTRIADNQEP